MLGDNHILASPISAVLFIQQNNTKFGLVIRPVSGDFCLYEFD